MLTCLRLPAAFCAFVSVGCANAGAPAVEAYPVSPGYPPPPYPPQSAYGWPQRQPVYAQGAAPYLPPVQPRPYYAAPPRLPSPVAAEGPVYQPDPEGHPVEILRDDAPNRRYAALDLVRCEAELTRRGVPFVHGEATAGVMAPERLRGPLRGVSIHSSLSPAARETSSMEIFDCRLVLALDDFAALAYARGIVEMIHYSAYRSQSSHGCTAKYAGLQHCGALAVDIATFKRSDGTEWNVERDFHGKVGSATCGPAAHPVSSAPASVGLWGLVCDTAARGIFHVILTPNHNAEHVNHFHVEVTPDADWMLIN